MEHEINERPENTENKGQGYIPRPAWQVWGARVGLVIMIVAVALYYWNIASGGMG